MKICGIKLTHDAGISLINNGKLEFCIELEKIENNNRFKILDDLSLIPSLLKNYGHSIDSIDKFVIDGWVGLENAQIKSKNGASEVILPVAPYHEADLFDSVLKKYSFSSLTLDGQCITYHSYTHVAGHILGSYCTSSFAKKGEDSLVLIWDGGMYPRLYHVNPFDRKIENLGPLFYMGVNIYSIFSQHFGPFKINENVIKDELSIAGKAMAYIACGKKKEEIIADLFEVYYQNIDEAMQFSMIPFFPYSFTQKFKLLVRDRGYSDEDILTSFHFFLEQLLISSLKDKLSTITHTSKNLCFGGGAGLNIKWNSTLRNSDLFKDVWICPFPNDSGSAIGTACCEMFNQEDFLSIDWDVYKGPKILYNKASEGWISKQCSVKELASLLHQTGEPVVFLNAQSELGPRALGNRSIVAAATREEMKNILNWIKFREPYRPVAPLCMEEKAAEIFDPGCQDPFMLFDHKIRESWMDKIPAVAHLDGTARLQTVSASSNPLIYELLVEYEKLSGIPVLCNTSANLKGSGFFPDVFSATQWGKVNYVWCHGILFEKKEKNRFSIT